MMRKALSVASRRCSDERRDSAVERKLNQHAGGTRDTSRHGVEKDARAPTQQQTEHQEDEVVGVEIRNRRRGAMIGKLLHEPHGTKRGNRDVEDG